MADKADFVAFLNQGVGLRHNQAAAAVNGANLAVGVFRQHVADLNDAAAVERVAVAGLHHHQAGEVAGKTQYLQRPHIVEQAGQMAGNQLFGVDGIGYGEGIERGDMPVFGAVVEIVRRAHAGDAVGNIEKIGGHFAGQQIGFVAAGERQQHIGVGGAHLFEQHRRGAVADHGLHIDQAADVAQGVFVGVDDADVVVGHIRQLLRDGGTDLAAA